MSKAGGGGGGSSAYNSNAVTLQTASSAATGVDPYIEVEYTSASATGETVTTTTTISGAQSKTLRLKRDTVGIHTVQCKVSHPTAVNNPASSDTRENDPIWTDKVEFSALSAVNLTRTNLRYEITKDYSKGTHKAETVNLFVQPMTLAGTPTHSNATRNIHVYPPEEDIAVKITMSGSAGESFNGNTGGQGGMSIFTYTLLKNTEYTFKLGCTVEPTSSIGRGGAGAYFYEGGRLLVACGGGGAAGWSHIGGRGGGAGDFGSPKWSYHVGKDNFHRTFEYGASWDENTAANRVNTKYHPTKKESDGILRSSMNEQDQYGLLSKLDYKLNDDLALQFGADWRTATIGHYLSLIHI